MKKVLVLIAVVMSGCTSAEFYVKRSDVVVTTIDTTKMWILNNTDGKTIYEAWETGAFGTKTKLYLIDSISFQKKCNLAYNN